MQMIGKTSMFSQRVVVQRSREWRIFSKPHRFFGQIWSCNHRFHSEVGRNLVAFWVVGGQNSWLGGLLLIKNSSSSAPQVFPWPEGQTAAVT